MRDVAAIGGLWVLGALPYEYLIVKNMIHSGDVLGTLASAAFGNRWRADVLNIHLSWKLVREDLLYLVLNFPTPNALLFLAGLVGLRRTRGTSGFPAIIMALLVLFFLFACRYTVVDRFAFFLPFYCVVAVVVGVGVYELVGWGLSHRRRFGGASPTLLVAAFSLLPVAVYALLPTLAQRLHLSLGTRQDIPYRNDYEYFLRPWRTGDTGAQRFAREALEQGRTRRHHLRGQHDRAPAAVRAGSREPAAGCEDRRRSGRQPGGPAGPGGDDAPVAGRAFRFTSSPAAPDIAPRSCSRGTSSPRPASCGASSANPNPQHTEGSDSPLWPRQSPPHARWFATRSPIS